MCQTLMLRFSPEIRFFASSIENSLKNLHEDLVDTVPDLVKKNMKDKGEEKISKTEFKSRC